MGDRATGAPGPRRRPHGVTASLPAQRIVR